MPLPHNALILVADGRKALFLRNKGDARQLDFRVTADREREDRKDSDIKTAPSGQSPGLGAAGGTMQETDFHQQDEDRFAKTLADEINAMALASKFDSLVVIAPARTMGVLRPLWHKEVSGRIFSEYVKEMTDRPVADIEALIVGESAPPG